MMCGRYTPSCHELVRFSSEDQPVILLRSGGMVESLQSNRAWRCAVLDNFCV
jgi:hypothetical protein